MIRSVFGIILLCGAEYVSGSVATNVKKNNSADNQAYDRATVVQKWTLPDELLEISGMVFTGEKTLACVQDEHGIIFQYDLEQQKITGKIEFDGPGDYEGIAYDGRNYYVLRSDGLIYSVTPEGKTETISTGLSAENDAEGLYYDKSSSSLLLAFKGKGPSAEKNRKGVYAYDLNSKKFNLTPLFVIKAIEEKESKKKATIAESPAVVADKDDKGPIQPSEVAYDKSSGNYYLTNGGKPTLLIVDETGIQKSVHNLKELGLDQPEGIAISPAGELYISSEGVKGKTKGIIIKVSLQ